MLPTQGFIVLACHDQLDNRAVLVGIGNGAIAEVDDQITIDIGVGADRDEHDWCVKKYCFVVRVRDKGMVFE